MTQAQAQPLTLAAFLQLPETKPASEYIDGQILQKPMPKGKHSRLQLKLCNAINAVTEASRIAYAFPELRCSFGTRSVVPDIAVMRWGRIPFDAAGEPPNDFPLPPDWAIEILSPEQRANRVTDNLLYCLEAGCELGWLIDPEDRSVLVLRSRQQPIFGDGDTTLPVMTGVDLTLTADQLFSWLRMAS